MKYLLLLLIFLFISNSYAYDWQEPDWSITSTLDEGNPRPNLYNLPAEQFKKVKDDGYIHALVYPVSVTGLLIPYEPIKYLVEADSKNPLKKFIAKIAQRQLGYSTMEGMYDWLGLNHFPEADAPDVFRVPFPNNEKPDYSMGASIVDTKEGKGLTFGCAACHSGTFMGRTVMGLTNKRSRANEFFHMAKKYIPKVPTLFFKMSTNATKLEGQMYKRTRANLNSVGEVPPKVLGLDTSLPHVALSLARRNEDPYATKNRSLERNPRKNPLEDMTADSKPMPWWNLKYKTRWLSDGSIVAGNPVLTNFLWNELGRGTDLKELEKWMQDNEETTKQLTAAVFATNAPHWTDFFPAETLDIQAAKRGEKTFTKSCQKCHGQYSKGWSLPNSEELTMEEKLKTVQTKYSKRTKVKDVGTDPNRYKATKYFADSLNKLAISKWMKTTVVPQVGYVPPPLEGIFLRYPYFHNNSIPSLCALMEKVEDRPKFFVQGPSLKDEHYDRDCVGYPVGDKIPKEWMKDKGAHYKVGASGLKNIGHTKFFYNEDGSPKMNEIQKKDLREFLKTL